MNDTKHLEPRRRATSGIKLLRLDLLPQGKSPTEDLSCEWSPAQPTENLSPFVASKHLGIEVWSEASLVKKRYRTLQLRYPPELFPERHLDWRPSYQLLSSPRARINWYWQSGLIPEFSSDKATDLSVLWDESSCELQISPKICLTRLVTEKDHSHS